MTGDIEKGLIAIAKGVTNLGKGIAWLGFWLFLGSCAESNTTIIELKEQVKTEITEMVK